MTNTEKLLQSIAKQTTSRDRRQASMELEKYFSANGYKISDRTTFEKTFKQFYDVKNAK